MLLQSDPVTQHSRHLDPTDSDDFDADLFLSQVKQNSEQKNKVADNS